MEKIIQAQTYYDYSLIYGLVRGCDRDPFVPVIL